MQRLEITTRIAADGILHLPVKEFADQEVQVLGHGRILSANDGFRCALPILREISEVTALRRP